MERVNALITALTLGVAIFFGLAQLVWLSGTFIAAIVLVLLEKWRDSLPMNRRVVDSRAPPHW